MIQSKMRQLLCTLPWLLIFSGPAQCGIIYELIDASGGIKATLDFDPVASGASATTGWSSPSGNSLASLLDGGISGLKVDFGSGLEAAIGGDINELSPGTFFSFDGSELDFGFFFGNDTAGFPVVRFSSFNLDRLTADNLPASDSIAASLIGNPTQSFDFGVLGDWRLPTSTVPSVPEPATLGLFGLGLLLMLRKSR